VKVVYCGALGDGVVLAVAGAEVHCAPGAVVDVPDEVGAELVARGDFRRAKKEE
jgi:hypothetical protein